MRGDSSRKVQHQQQRKPRKKTKPPALTKKHKKKRRRGPRRPQKPIPPAVPQGNLSMPTSVSLPVETAQIRSVMVLTTPSIISVALQLGHRSHSIDEPRPCSLQCNFYQISDWVRSEIKFLTVTQKADAEIENLSALRFFCFSRNSIYVSTEMFRQKSDTLLILAGVKHFDQSNEASVSARHFSFICPFHFLKITI